MRSSNPAGVTDRAVAATSAEFQPFEYMRDLDQYFTRADVARVYAREISDRWDNPDVLFVEPSAGNGAFLHPLREAGRKVRAMDVVPQARGIESGNFLADHGIFAGDHSATVVIGNPPFGRNACTAVRFFNHAAAHADEIAFIVPRTFRKLSVERRLDRSFHLYEDRDVGRFAFVLDGSPHDVPCAWQIWTRKTVERKMREPPPVDHLITYTTPGHACFAMRRVGFHAGRVVTGDLQDLSRTTHYFMQEMAVGVIEALRRANWVDLASQTAGVRSLSKAEIAFRLADIYHL